MRIQLIEWAGMVGFSAAIGVALGFYGGGDWRGAAIAGAGMGGAYLLGRWLR